MKSAVMVASAFLALLGCSSGTQNASDAGSDASAGDSGAKDSSATDAGAPSCQDYCTAIMTNCTSTTDPDSGLPVGNQQYTDMQNCLNSCKAMPVGALSDTSGNTLGCRLYHATAAKSDPVTHCPHAGPAGDGTCGKDCDGFCQLAMMYCTASNNAAVFTSLADCQSTCAKFPDTERFNIGVQADMSVACLVYHAQEASSDPPDHCLGDIIADDAGDLSTTCHN